MAKATRSPNRKSVVIVGTGWGGATLSRAIDDSKYKIVVLSPESTTPYTPLLASAACGLYDFSIVETPIRHQTKPIHFIKSRVEDVDFEKKICHCVPAFDDPPDAAPKQFTIPYDHLILAPGCTNNTFDTPGVAEHAFFVRNARDARRIQTRIKNCMERASLPGLTPAEIRDILHFVVIGAGPTGTEIVSELSDLFHEDYARLYPHLKQHIRISLHDVAPEILAGFDKNLQDYAMSSFNEKDVDVYTESHIEKIDESSIHTKEMGRVPCGIVIWSTGNKVVPLVEKLPCKRAEKGMPRMQTDDFLRLKDKHGDPVSDVFALGDAADIEGASLPGTAEVACQKANWLAKALNHDFDEVNISRFQYTQRPLVAYLGQSDGVISGKMDYTGAEAWLAWRSKNFLWTRTWRQRVLVLVSWVLDRLTGRAIAPW